MNRQRVYNQRQCYVFRIGHINITGVEALSYYKNLGGYSKCFDNIEQALTALLNVDKYPDMPRFVSFTFSDLLLGALSGENIVKTIQTCAGLTANRLGHSGESVLINCRINEPITKNQSDRLKKIGVDNLIPMPERWGMQVYLDTLSEILLGIPRWPHFLVQGNEVPILNIAKKSYNFKLTRREQEIADLITKRALSNKEIARVLKVSESTVKLHVGHLLKKHGLKNRVQLSRAHSVGLGV